MNFIEVKMMMMMMKRGMAISARKRAFLLNWKTGTYYHYVEIVKEILVFVFSVHMTSTKQWGMTTICCG